MRAAATILGVSHTTMWRLIRDGVLPAERDPLDRRQKLVRVADIERLKSEESQAERPWPRTIGAANLGVQSDEVDAWLDVNVPLC